MTALITRSGKGTALTPGEHDANMGEIERRTGAGWNDMVSDVLIRGGNAPTWSSWMGGIGAYEFLSGQSQECFCNFHVRHDYVRDTMVYPHMHFIVQDGTKSGVVRLGFEYTWARRADSTGQTVFPSTNTIYVEYPVGVGSTSLHIVAEAPEGAGIPGTGIETDAMICVRTFRDGAHANDTFAASIYLITVDLHYQCDTAATPSRFPPFT